jgi:hypothetical protein
VPGAPHSRTLRAVRRRKTSRRFWSAAALRRFGSFGRTSSKARGAAHRPDTLLASCAALNSCGFQGRRAGGRRSDALSSQIHSFVQFVPFVVARKGSLGSGCAWTAKCNNLSFSRRSWARFQAASSVTCSMRNGMEWNRQWTQMNANSEALPRIFYLCSRGGKRSGVKDEPTRDPPAKLAKPAKVGGSLRLGELGALGGR